MKCYIEVKKRSDMRAFPVKSSSHVNSCKLSKRCDGANSAVRAPHKGRVALNHTITVGPATDTHEVRACFWILFNDYERKVVTLVRKRRKEKRTFDARYYGIHHICAVCICLSSRCNSREGEGPSADDAHCSQTNEESYGDRHQYSALRSCVRMVVCFACLRVWKHQ